MEAIFPLNAPFFSPTQLLSLAADFDFHCILVLFIALILMKLCRSLPGQKK